MPLCVEHKGAFFYKKETKNYSYQKGCLNPIRWEVHDPLVSGNRLAFGDLP